MPQYESEYLFEEKEIIDSFDEYLCSEENRIKSLRQTYERFRQQNTIALEDKDLFLSHPNDVYFLIKRIAIEWKNVESMLELNITSMVKLLLRKTSIDSSKLKYAEAVEGYEYLTNYHKLDITSAANGLIVAQNMTTSGELKVLKSLSNQTFDAFDCHSIGKQSFFLWNYLSAVLWFEETLKRADSISREQWRQYIFESISVSEFKIENFDTFMNELKTLSKTNSVAKFTFDFISSKNKSEQEQLRIQPIRRFYTKELYDISDDLCRGQKLMIISYESKLKCFYLNTTLRPYLRLTRVRVEELYKRPQIVLIHNFLSETEAQTLINIYKPKLEQAKVAKPNDNLPNISNNRIAHVVQDITRHSLFKTGRRISEITTLKLGDTNQVIRYNVRGLNVLHHDATNESNSIAFGRYANFLIYLDDNVVGGATVFPKQNVSVFPQKYSALYFYHLMSSGEIDQDMDHMACPVLFGEKWAALLTINIKLQTHHKCSDNRYEKKKAF